MNRMGIKIIVGESSKFTVQGSEIADCGLPTADLEFIPFY